MRNKIREDNLASDDSGFCSEIAFLPSPFFSLFCGSWIRICRRDQWEGDEAKLMEGGLRGRP